MTADFYFVNGTEDVPEAPWWVSPSRARRSETSRGAFLPEVSATSCVVTGRHRWHLPTVHEVKTKEKFTTATCTECLQQRRYPAQAWLAERSKQMKATATGSVTTHRVEIPAALPIDSKQAWDAVFDCLAYMATGTGDQLAQLARQIDNSATFEREFVDVVDQLGLVELNRRQDGSVNRFEIAATTLALMSDGDMLLTGYWPLSTLESTVGVVEAQGGHFVEVDNLYLPMVTGVEPSRVASMLDEGIQLQFDAGLNMLHALPSMSHIISSLEEIPMPGWTALEGFNFDDGRWHDSNTSELPGAYRISNRFTKVYVIRTEEMIANDRAALVTSNLSKHVAANLSGRALMAYDNEQKTLRVPMGAGLPGLYGRSAVLCSGRVPQIDKATFSHVYFDVPEEFALELAEKLSS